MPTDDVDNYMMYDGLGQLDSVSMSGVAINRTGSIN